VSAPRLRLVQRRDCPLCEEMLAELKRFARAHPLPPVEIVDVDSDATLTRRHGLHVPVLLLDGALVCRHRLDAAELARLLRDGPRAP
jgi:predicted thioredoxin/glutaredoxin